MKALLALALLGALPAASPAPAPPVKTGLGTQWDADMPPAKYDRETAVVVVFVADVGPYCGTAPPGLVILACTKRLKDGSPIIFMPHPLGAAQNGEVYARVLTHELAHANGWPWNHPAE